MKAFILIESEMGEVAEVIRGISDIPGVVSDRAVIGPYDIIAQVEADSLDSVGKIVVANIQSVSGVTGTMTLPVVEV